MLAGAGESVEKRGLAHVGVAGKSYHDIVAGRFFAAHPCASSNGADADAAAVLRPYGYDRPADEIGRRVPGGAAAYAADESVSRETYIEKSPAHGAGCADLAYHAFLPGPYVAQTYNFVHYQDHSLIGIYKPILFGAVPCRYEKTQPLSARTAAVRLSKKSF
jgi:hypothetical protein